MNRLLLSRHTGQLRIPAKGLQKSDTLELDCRDQGGLQVDEYLFCIGAESFRLPPG